MTNLRMWFWDEDFQGKFCIDNPTAIPRIGEFVSSDKISGWVSHVQYEYMDAKYGSAFDLVINIYLKDKK